MRSSANVMNCVEFGFDRSGGFGSARGQYRQLRPIAVDRPTRPYNIASTIVQQVMISLPTAVPLTSMSSSRLRCKLDRPIQAIYKYTK
jgi:hypothetical protein